MIKSKSLVKHMEHKEVVAYLLKHTEYQLPTGEQAEHIQDSDYQTFLVDEQIDGRPVVYDKFSQCYRVTHNLFKNNIVVVRKDSL